VILQDFVVDDRDVGEGELAFAALHDPDSQALDVPFLELVAPVWLEETGADDQDTAGIIIVVAQTYGLDGLAGTGVVG